MIKKNHFQIKPAVVFTAMALAVYFPYSSATPLGSGGTEDNPNILTEQNYEADNSVEGYYNFSNKNDVTITGSLTNYNNRNNSFNLESAANLSLLNSGIVTSSNVKVYAGKSLTLSTTSKFRAFEGGVITLEATENLNINSGTLEAGEEGEIKLCANSITLSSAQATDGGKIDLKAADSISLDNIKATGPNTKNQSIFEAKSKGITVNGDVEAAANGTINLIASDSVSGNKFSVSSGATINVDTKALTINNGLSIEHNQNNLVDKPTEFNYISTDGTFIIKGVAGDNGQSIIIGRSSNEEATRKANVNTKSITVTEGVYVAKKNSFLNFNASESITINASKKTEKALHTDNFGEINLTASNLTLNGDIQADWGSKVTLTGDDAIDITGHLHSTYYSVIDVTGGANSKFIGSASTQKINPSDQNGIIHLDFDDSNWSLTDSSDVTSLTMKTSTIDFTYTPTIKAFPLSYRKLTSETFSGEGNTLVMRIDIAKEDANNTLLDQFNITGKGLGTHTADLKIDAKDLAPNKFHSENWLISQGADSNMTILNKEGTNEFSGNGMVTTWGLVFVANGEEDKLNSSEGLAQLVGNTTGTGEGKWYLVRNDEEIVDPDPEQPEPDDPSEMQQITNLGISATQAMSFASELDDLRSRLGEVRYGSQDGAWVRAGYAKETADGYNGRGFEQKTHDLHIGFDRLVASDEDSSWLLGGALRYAKSKQDGYAAARGGDGEVEQYSAKLYATYFNAQGSYVDLVAQAGRYSQDIAGLANDKSSAFNADYTTYGYGASVEVGHMFSFNEKVDDRQWYNHTFIEPQLQLSYFNAHGKDYKTSTGMAVSQSDADFLTARAGIVLGQKFNYGTADDLDKRYFQIGLKGGVKYEFMGDQDIRFTGVEGVTKTRSADDVDGARYYYGVTADWQLSDDFRAYATVEREEGDHYTKDFDVSIGLKYQF